MIRFATVGDNCMDVYEELGQVYGGGNPLNVSVYLRRLGEEVSYSGVVGTDKYGEIMLKMLRDRGIDVSHVQVVDGSTAITKVIVRDGERIFSAYEGGVMDHYKLREEDFDFLASHDIIISGIWGEIHPDLPRLHAMGTPIAFDFSDQPNHPVVEQAMPYVDYAFFSWGDAEVDEELMAFMKKQHARGPKMVITTLGINGSVCYDGQQFHRFGIIPCQVVDTMGAGDSFIAGFLRGIMLGNDIPTSMKMGAENSSVTLQYQGAW